MNQREDGLYVPSTFAASSSRALNVAGIVLAIALSLGVFLALEFSR